MTREKYIEYRRLREKYKNPPIRLETTTALHLCCLEQCVRIRMVRISVLSTKQENVQDGPCEARALGCTLV